MNMIWIEICDHDKAEAGVDIIIPPMSVITAGWFADGRMNVDFNLFDPIFITYKDKESEENLIDRIKFMKKLEDIVFKGYCRLYLSGEIAA